MNAHDLILFSAAIAALLGVWLNRGGRPAVALSLSKGKSVLIEKNTPKVINLVASDQQGEPNAVLSSVPAYASSDPSVLTVTPAPDGGSVTIVGVKQGSADVTVTATSTASKDPLKAVLNVVVSAGPAVSLTLVPADAPAPSPSPTPAPANPG